MLATVSGVIALFFWSGSVAVNRSAAEKLNPLTVGSCVYLISGALYLAGMLSSRTTREKFVKLPPARTAVCVLLLTGYLVCYYLALGLSHNREEALEAGLMNHTWPAQTVVLSLLILGMKARWTLIPGLLLALAGSFGQAAAHGAANFHMTLPCILALFGALHWATYSNVTRRWADSMPITPLPLCMFAGGIVLAVLRCAFGGEDHWTREVCWEVLYSALCPSLLGYTLWEYSMRRGNIILVVALSFLTPIFSTVISSIYWHQAVDGRIWYGCVAIILGAIICKRSVTAPEPATAVTVPAAVTRSDSSTPQLAEAKL